MIRADGNVEDDPSPIGAQGFGNGTLDTEPDGCSSVTVQPGVCGVRRLVRFGRHDEEIRPA
jgi:hypothetical protein